MSGLEENDNSSSGSEELEDAVEDLDCADRDNCDKEITKLIYERVKRKSWATNSRNTCKHLRARAMTDGRLIDTAGHQTLVTANVSLKRMTRMFRKLNAFSLRIQSLHDCRFLQVGYKDLPVDIKQKDDKERK